MIGCKSDMQLAMDRGVQYYKWEKTDDAIYEFKYIIHNLGADPKNLDYNNILLLAHAHRLLAISYAKKTWYKDALEEVKIAFKLSPTDENKELINLIQKKIAPESSNDTSIKSVNQ